MALEFYKSLTTDGGIEGSIIYSGVKGALLPLVTSQNRLLGVDIHRKFFIKPDVDTALKIGLDTYGVFNAVIFEETTYGENVSALLGTETKYGASKIVQLEDSATLTETVNGAGGLADIKKIRVEKDEHSFVLFRVGDFIRIGTELATINAVTDVITHWEITLTTPITYAQLIGSMAFSVIDVATITAGTVKGFWILVKVSAGDTSTLDYNTLGIDIVV